VNEPGSRDERRPWRPDFVLIALIILGLAILLILTYDVWAPGH